MRNFWISIPAAEDNRLIAKSCSDCGVEKQEQSKDFQQVRKQGTWLFIAAIANSGLGFVFWAIAARMFRHDYVGIAVSVTTLATLGTSLSVLGLDQGLIRFVAGASRPRRLVLQTLAIGCAVGTTIGLVLAVLVYVAGSGGGIASGDIPLVVGSVVIICVFQVWLFLTDASLIAAGRNQFVTFRASVYGITKIALLLVVSRVLTGLLVAFTISIIVAIAVGLYASVRSWPKENPRGEERNLNEVAKLSLGNYASAILWTLPDRIAPSIVLIAYGPEPVAYFGLAFLLADTVTYLPASFGTSAFAHGSRQRALDLDLIQKLAKWLTYLLVPLIILGVIFSDLAMRLLGGVQFQQHALILQLFLLAVLPKIGLNLIKAQLNVQKRIRLLIMLGVVTGVPILTMFIGGIALGVSLDLLPAAWVIGSVAGFLVVAKWVGWRLPGRQGANKT